MLGETVFIFSEARGWKDVRWIGDTSSVEAGFLGRLCVLEMGGRRQEYSIAGSRERSYDCFTTVSHQLKSRHPAASWALKLPRREDQGDGLIGGDEKGSLLSWTRQNLVELAGNIHNYDGSG